MRTRSWILAALWVGVGLCAAPAGAAWEPEGVDLTRPRILYRPGDLAGVAERLDREPYLTVLRDMEGRIRLGLGVALDDHAIASERFKARATKDLAFLWALDRRLEDGRAVPFAGPEERAAAGDRVRDLLLNMFTVSRLVAGGRLGGPDRDISTSEELLQYATAYDVMAGAGYAFSPEDEARIVDNIASLASSLYENYTRPETANNAVLLHQNNHRSKSGAALAVAGIVLAEYTPEPGSDPRSIREPADWIAYGIDQVDLIMRWVLMTGDGVYAEGPFYLRYASQNLIPFLRAWDRLVDGADVTFGDRTYPSYWRHPVWRRAQRWMLAMTLPDGSFAPIDDGNVGRSFYFGAAPQDHPLAPAFAWRWARAPQPFETDGNIDMGPDSILYFDDTLAPAPPAIPPTAFYVEGGNAILRSGWEPGAVMAVVLGEHDTASEFGRDRDGLGVFPQSHEHAEPGAFLLDAFGERLAMDPGFLNFPDRLRVNQPQHHNTILVDGRGPIDYLGASFRWVIDGLERRHPGDGDASLSENLDGTFLDATTVTTRYGLGLFTPEDEAPRIERRFLFPGHRYLAIADHVEGSRGRSHRYTWLLHGNGGGTSGGAYEDVPGGGRWTRNARLDAGFAFTPGTFRERTTDTGIHEEYATKRELTHTVLRSDAEGAEVRSVGLVYPTPLGSEPPRIEELAGTRSAALRLVDETEGRRVVVLHGSEVSQDAEALALAVESDGELLLFETSVDGGLALAWAEQATRLSHGGSPLLEAVTPGLLGVAPSAERVDLVLDNADPSFVLPALPFGPGSADGACALRRRGGAVEIALGRERRVTLRPDTGNSAPAADPGPDRRVAPGTSVVLDGRASCDADGDALSARWELVSAPPPSAQRLEDAHGFQPVLLADHPGPYRVRLVVTDEAGAESLPREVLVIAGEPCSDGLDGDLDGLFDTDDPDCDRERRRAPVAVADRYALGSGGAPSGVVAVRSVVANDRDAEPGPLVAVLETPPTAGDLWLRPDGTFDYTPHGAGPDRFTYRARDADGNESAPVEVRLEPGAATAPDRLLLLLLGPDPRRAWGALLEGDFRVERSAGGEATVVRGEGALPDAGGARVEVALDFAAGSGGSARIGDATASSATGELFSHVSGEVIGFARLDEPGEPQRLLLFSILEPGGVFPVPPGPDL